MRAKAQRWGNSLAVRIPKAIADEVGVREDDELEIEVAGKAIRMRPRRREVTLDDLLARITPENIHEEADFGVSAGREPW
jgi:antitoxin MazE